MIEILFDQFGQLRPHVIRKCLRRAEGVDEGQLGPHDHTAAVAQIVEILRVLVMRQADGGAAEFFNQLEILVVLGGTDGPALVEPVLMAVDSVERVVPAIQEKALLGVDAEGPETERLRDRVRQSLAIAYLHGQLVEIRIAETIPQVRVGKRDFLGDVGRCTGVDVACVSSSAADFLLRSVMRQRIVAVFAVELALRSFVVISSSARSGVTASCLM